MLRIALVTGLVLSAPFAVTPSTVTLPGELHLTLPGSGTWTALAVWAIAASLLETALVLRLGSLRAGSRRVVLLVESLVIAACGVYTAAGVKAAVIPLVASITAVVLLRLDHVRHGFNRATADRWLVGRRIRGVLYSGYALPDPTAAKPSQAVRYRMGVDCDAGGFPIEDGITSS